MQISSTLSLIDTHCHISHILNKQSNNDFSEEEIQEVIRILDRAVQVGVKHSIEIGTTRDDSLLSVLLAERFPQISAAIGIHPNKSSSAYNDDRRFLETLLKRSGDTIIAIGECGLDKHYPGYNLEYQKGLFTAQIELALTYNKALVVHTRDAQEETFRVLEQYKNDLKRVTIHCYSNSLDFAQQVTSWGWFLGIGGTVTYPKNSVLRDIVTRIGLAGIVLETDAPFLPPQAFRGTRNEPAHIASIATFIADILGITLEDVARITSNNAIKLFGLKTI